MKKMIHIALLSISSAAFAVDSLEMSGQIKVQVMPNQTGIRASATPMTFMLPAIKLLPKARQYLQGKLRHYAPDLSPAANFVGELPPHVHLGMQGTPVLDQGSHGSCATFANTAALDAVMGAGDYISQLCSLELGAYLAIHDRAEVSGWNGSWGPWVLDQIMTYGIIPKNYQKLEGCAGVREYPGDSMVDEGRPMSDGAFLEHSIPLKNLIEWKSLLRTPGTLSAQTDSDDLVTAIKQELAKGNRLTIGMLLDIQRGHAGALGQNKVIHDTWMITPEIVMDMIEGDIAAGHELVITGYDDELVVQDEKGYMNRGVFTLRNSWSVLAGDQGDYYVTYDYIQMLGMEVQAIQLKK